MAKIFLMSEINISVNGEVRDIPVGLDLDRLLDFFTLPKQRIAIELNDTVVRRIEWPRTFVNDGDKIEIVHFVGGG